MMTTFFHDYLPIFVFEERNQPLVEHGTAYRTRVVQTGWLAVFVTLIALFCGWVTTLPAFWAERILPGSLTLFFLLVALGCWRELSFQWRFRHGIVVRGQIMAREIVIREYTRRPGVWATRPALRITYRFCSPTTGQEVTRTDEKVPWLVALPDVVTPIAILYVDDSLQMVL